MPAPCSRTAVRLLCALALVAVPGCGVFAGTASPGQVSTGEHGTHPAGLATPPTASGPASPSPVAQPAATRDPPLAGQVVGIDPGHNGGNGSDPGYINHQIWNGRQWEACDTTGTQTDSGYPEPRFTFAVARFLRADLRRAGARVVMTRHGNDGAGPCVNRRAQLLNRAHPAVAIDIHADGGPSWGRGFSILEPVPDGPNDKVINASRAFGRDVRRAMLSHTTMPVSNYYGRDGIEPRDDLAGLNLATEPKILIECGNMRNAADAALLTSTRFQRQLARALTDAVLAYLT